MSNRGSVTDSATWRIAVVHGNAVYRQKLSDALRGSHDVHVATRVSTPAQLEGRLTSGEVNVVLLDAELLDAETSGAAVLDGLASDGRIFAMTRDPSAYRHADPRVRPTPYPNQPLQDDDLALVTSSVLNVLEDGPTTRGTRREPRTPRIVAIGSSTGGPEALMRVLPQLEADLPVPLVIAQHMPAGFTSDLARQLDRASALTVVEAQLGMTAEPGFAYIAPGGVHLGVTADAETIRLETSNADPINSARPSVDYLFDSLSDALDGRCVGVVLTGMGDDGMRACVRMRASGGKIIAQDESSCTIYGMPRAVVEAGAASCVLPLDAIAHRIAEELRWVPR